MKSENHKTVVQHKLISFPYYKIRQKKKNNNAIGHSLMALFEIKPLNLNYFDLPDLYLMPRLLLYIHKTGFSQTCVAIPEGKNVKYSAVCDSQIAFLAGPAQL